MSLPQPRHGFLVAVFVALALVFFVHAPVSGAEREGAITPAGDFASLDVSAPALDSIDPRSAAPAADVQAPLVARSFAALLSLPRPRTRTIELMLERVDSPLTTRRPSMLPALYVSFGALQALDFVSTRQGLGAGAREANPLMKGLARSRSGLMAVKVGVAAGTVFLSERMWKRTPAAANGMMVALNSAYAVGDVGLQGDVVKLREVAEVAVEQREAAPDQITIDHARTSRRAGDVRECGSRGTTA